MSNNENQNGLSKRELIRTQFRYPLDAGRFSFGEIWMQKIVGIILITAAIAGGANCQETATGLASWYSRESCKREGTGGEQILMASGKPLNDAAMTCAIWRTLPDGRVKRPDSRRLKVIALETGRSIVVRWADNGPGKKQRNEGVIIDLTPAAMRALAGEAGINAGRIKIKLEELK
jgi:rare lipoprotein A (peptidoglycan hydrolase)